MQWLNVTCKKQFKNKYSLKRRIKTQHAPTVTVTETRIQFKFGFAPFDNENNENEIDGIDKKTVKYASKSIEDTVINVLR